MNKFIQKSKSKFENFNYDFLSYKSTKHPITLVCNHHNYKFTISTRNHLNSKFGGCEKCDLEHRLLLLMNKSNSKFNNNYSFDKSTFINYINKVKITCKEHNYSFYVLPQNHINSKNGCCIYCDKRDRNYETKKFIENCNSKFDNRFDYSNIKILTNQNQIIDINCKIHNINFKIKASLHYHYVDGGCTKCTSLANKKRTTKIKNKIHYNIQLKDDEIFKNCIIVGFENLYKISNYGNIISNRKNINMRPYKNKNGYLKIRLNGKETKLFSIHFLVAKHFINNHENKKYIDHINRIRDDNYYKNLRWVTHKENTCNRGKKIIRKSTKMEIENTNDFLNIGIIDNFDFSDYSISNTGNIINKYNKLLTKYLNDGYYIVSLNDKRTKKRKIIRVHRLVAFKFCQKNNIKYNVVNHIDNNRTNNFYKNLEWCNIKYNTREYFKKKIHQVDIKTNKIINTFSHYVDVYKFLNKNYNSNISKCCHGYLNTAYGYKWRLD